MFLKLAAVLVVIGFFQPIVGQDVQCFDSSNPKIMASGLCCLYECEEGKMIFQGASNKCEIIETLSESVEVCYMDNCNNDKICQKKSKSGVWLWILIGGLILFFIFGVGLAICFCKGIYCFNCNHQQLQDDAEAMRDMVQQ